MKIKIGYKLAVLSLLFSVHSLLANLKSDAFKSLDFTDITKEEIHNLDTLNRVEQIIDFGKSFLGKPYRFKLENGVVFDCSGFLSYIFGKFQMDLPRSGTGIAQKSTKIELSEVRKGDFLFFKGRDLSKNTVGHLSMVIDVDSTNIRMIHSCNRGIIVEDYQKNAYYTKRFLYAGRPFETDFQLTTTANVNSEIAQITELSEPVLVDSYQKSIKIIGVGDMMLGTNYPGNHLPPNDGKDLLRPVKEIIKSGDVSFGNLEGVILSGKGEPKRCSNPKLCYAFKMPDHFINHIKDAGFNLLSLANNHSRDFGKTGTENTKKILTEAGIPHAGLLEIPYTTFVKDEVKYGFAAFAPNTGTVSINDLKRAKEIISHLDSISDIVIVSFHGGAEGPAHKHITRKSEKFYGENRGNPYEFARLAIDSGADIVFGHGPHVTRAVDLYKNRFIAYSMGNFCTYGRFNLSGSAGIAPIVEVDVNSKGEFLRGKIHSTRQLGAGGPVLDNQNLALKEIISLTKADIPECTLKLDSSGVITK